jgi:hypothetical protein
VAGQTALDRNRSLAAPADTEAESRVGEHHAHAGADADRLDQVGRRQLAVGRDEVADHAQGLVGGGLALLAVEVNSSSQSHGFEVKRSRQYPGRRCMCATAITRISSGSGA